MGDTPDQTIVAVTSGALRLSTFSAGTWRSATRAVGSVSLTPSRVRRRLRWRAETPSFETAQIYVPGRTFAEFADAMQRAGTVLRAQPVDSVAFADPLVGHLCLSLARAHQAGSPEILAAPIAQALVVRLLSMQNPRLLLEDEFRATTRLRGKQLSDVLEFMRANCRERLTLDRLADQVGYSRFHFARSFRDAVGMPPHRFILDQRLQAAATMLTETDFTVFNIALACGFSSAAHLSTAFKRRFAQTPSDYRRGRERTCISIA